MTPSKKINSSGIEIPIVVTPADGEQNKVTCNPGTFPFTRGIYPDMYRGRLWTMRQYAGFGTAAETNGRFKYLLERGQTGLSVAFDLATQIGYDSDHPMAQGEVGRTGVAIDSLEDMETLFDGIPLDKVSTSMTINATAVVLLAMYVVVGKKQGVPPDQLKGTVQNDILKEFIARGTYIMAPQPSMRIITDIFTWADGNLPLYNTISISGYHIREAGSTAAQEVAFTLANGIAYCEAALRVGLDINKFAPKLSFFFAAHNDLFEEVAKYRAARAIWARIVKERFKATNEKAMLLRFHTQTGGSTLTAQQPENNIVRTTLQALAAVMGGTQSLHTNSFDEALSLPTEKAAQIALRTQQILAFESGCADSADPLAGSYYVEYLTSQLEDRISRIMNQIDEQGGAIKCIENGYYSDEIGRAAYDTQRAIENGERVVVGVNRFIVGEESSTQPGMKVDPLLEKSQKERLKKMKAGRDNDKVENCLNHLRRTAEGSSNIVGPVIEAVENYVTVGEISEQFREVWGEYHAKN